MKKIEKDLNGNIDIEDIFTKLNELVNWINKHEKSGCHTKWVREKGKLRVVEPEEK